MEAYTYLTEQWLVDRRWWYVRENYCGKLMRSYTCVMDDYGDLIEASPI